MADEMLGIDLNAYRPDINDDDFDKLQANGLSFVFTRLTLGDDYVDPTADKYLRMAQDRGLVTGVYHFLKARGTADPSADGIAQAEHFIDGIRENAQHSGYPPDFMFLDVEENGVVWSQIIHFVERVRSVGLRIGLYTRETFYEPRFGGKPHVWDYTWLAHYTDDNRWLADWATPPEQESKRPESEFWQFADDFRWGSPDGKESVDGNMGHFATMKQMLDLARPTVLLDL